MKPTDFITMPGAATLAGLRRVALQAGRDRLTLVRRAENGLRPGVAVLMFTPKAVRDLGRFLEAHVAAAGVVPSDFRGDDLQNDEPVARVFKTMDQFLLQWVWIKAPLPDGSSVLIAFLIGEKLVTETFARQLTQLGCITNLT